MNSSQFLANKTSKMYAIRPVDFTFKVILYSILGVVGLYAIIANCLVLYLKRAQRKARKRNPVKSRPFGRSSVISSYVQSLALSNLLSGAVVIPLAITNNFVQDFVSTDLRCKAVRYAFLMPSIITINNMFVIGVERYMAVFHPLKVPSSKAVRGTIVGSWILGLLVTTVPSATFNRKRTELDEDTFTIICKHDSNSPIYRILFLGSVVLTYIIPIAILLAMNIRIARFLTRRSKLKLCRRKDVRYYGTSTFVYITFCFVIPYLFFIVLNTILKPLQLGWHVSHIISHISSVIAFANAAVCPTVLLVTMNDLREMMKEKGKRRSRKIQNNETLYVSTAV